MNIYNYITLFKAWNKKKLKKKYFPLNKYFTALYVYTLPLKFIDKTVVSSPNYTNFTKQH